MTTPQTKLLDRAVDNINAAKSAAERGRHADADANIACAAAILRALVDKRRALDAEIPTFSERYAQPSSQS